MRGRPLARAGGARSRGRRRGGVEVVYAIFMKAASRTRRDVFQRLKIEKETTLMEVRRRRIHEDGVAIQGRRVTDFVCLSTSSRKNVVTG